jgi:uncharacterized repeat protein (TIGR01451 family)
MSNYYQEVEVPIKIIDTKKQRSMKLKRKPKKVKKVKGVLKRFLKTAVYLALVLVLILSQTFILSAYEAHIINVTAHICNWSEIRSCGYWKHRSHIYQYLLPQTLGDEVVNTVPKADRILRSACGKCSGCGCDETMRGKLKGQLLAMKFNIARFGIGEYLVEGEGKTLNELVAEADDLLRQDPPPPDSVLEEMKNILDYLNNLEQIRFCSVTLPSDECELYLTKTANYNQVDRGDTITYHFTLDNIGRKVCTGSGVLLKDIFGDYLKYVDYASTKNPRYFRKFSNYVEWNFDNIYPNDPLIEVDLVMEVKNTAPCDSIITNFAKYWSKETGWGDPVIVDTQVICQSAPQTGIVINEFLPNPVGSDKASKPNGEWVELYNKGNEIDVAGWMLYDENNYHELPITSGNTDTGSTIITSGGFLVVYRNGDSDFALDNTGGDTVRLYDGEINAGAYLIDSHIYTTDALEGKSFARIPDGSENWVDPIPTPGEPNLLDGEEVFFGPALPEEGEEGYEETITYEITNEDNIPLEATGTTRGTTETPEEEPVIEEESVNEENIESEEPIVTEEIVETEETVLEEGVQEETAVEEEGEEQNIEEQEGVVEQAVETREESGEEIIAEETTETIPEEEPIKETPIVEEEDSIVEESPIEELIIEESIEEPAITEESGDPVEDPVVNEELTEIPVIDEPADIPDDDLPVGQSNNTSDGGEGDLDSQLDGSQSSSESTETNSGETTSSETTEIETPAE